MLNLFSHRKKKGLPPDKHRGVVSLSSETLGQKIFQFRKKIAEAEAINREIIALQQKDANKNNLFKQTHLYLCYNNRFYYYYHTKANWKWLNAGALTVFLFSVLIGSVIFFKAPLTTSSLADNPQQISVLVANNKKISADLSQENTETVGATVSSDGQTIGFDLLATGLNVPVSKQLGQVSTAVLPVYSTVNNGPLSKLLLPTQVNAAQGQSQVLPANTLAHIPASSSSADVADYHITEGVDLRYVKESWALKETLNILKPQDIEGNILQFAMTGSSLIFRPSPDGSWQAFKQSDKNNLSKAKAVFRIYPPTVHDANGNSGQISLNISNGLASYTIDPDWLNKAVFPITIDPTISPSGTTCTWTDGAADGQWATAGNWSCGHAPASGDAVEFNTTSTASATAASGVVSDNIYSVTLDTGYTGTVTLSAHPINSSTDDHIWNLETLTVNQGNLVLVGDTTVNPSPLPPGCSSTVICGEGTTINANTITIASGASINADGKGFTPQAGPGASVHGAGSYGGRGSGNSSYFNTTNPRGATYGSVRNPNSLGSGGTGWTSDGGGSIILNVSGTLTNNGRISSDGTGNGDSGNGSGGTVNINSGTLAGSGLISANSTVSYTGTTWGGGGRIALVATSNTFTGSAEAYSNIITTLIGAFSNYGGAGTIYQKVGGQTNGDLIINNNNTAAPVYFDNGPVTDLASGQSYTFDNIYLKGSGDLNTVNATLDISSTNLVDDGTGLLENGPGGNLITGSSYTIGSNLVVASDGGSFSDLANLTIASGGKLTNTLNDHNTTQTVNLNITNLTINSGGRIDVTNDGYPSGPGSANNAAPGGSSYGGLGGYGFAPSDGCTSSYGSQFCPPGPTYGSATQPTDLGSVYGGGAIKLTVSGSLVNNGLILSNGAANNPGGSGGSVFITTNSFSGSGAIEANGPVNATETNPGVGGGGRVAIYVTGGTDSYSGTKQALGGTQPSVGTSYEYEGNPGTVIYQHFPVTTVSSPTNNSTNVSIYPTVNFSVTDHESDYSRMKLEISTDNFSSDLYTFEQTASTSVFSQGQFTGMNKDSDGNGTLDMYNSGSSGTFEFTSPLTPGQTYQARLSACDPAGACGDLNEFPTSNNIITFTTSAITYLSFTQNGSDKTCTDTSSPQSIIGHQMSTIFNIQACDSLGEAAILSAGQSLSLSSSSGTGVFYSDSGGTNPITTLTIPSGSSAASFYYKDTTLGNPTLTITPGGKTWTAATQQQSIISGSPDHLVLSVTGNPAQVRAGDSTSVTVTAMDSYGNQASSFTGDKILHFAGANPSTSSPAGGTIYPTTTDKNNSPVAFGSDDTVTFSAGEGAAQEMILKLTEAVSITVTDYSSGSAGITTPTAFIAQVIPGALNYFGSSDYPSQSAGQWVTAGFSWDTTGLASGSNAPYNVVVTAYDAYDNTKYDYNGPFWFSMDSGKNYTFPYDSSSNDYTFTWSGDYSNHPTRQTTGDSLDNGSHIFSASTFTVNTGGTDQNWYLNGSSGVSSDLKINVKPTSVGSLSISFVPNITQNGIDSALSSDVVVTAYDVLGNIKTDYTGKVYFSSTDPKATLPFNQNSPYTFTLADSGSHTFSGSTFAFDTGGNQTITAIDSTSDPNNAFVVSSSALAIPPHPVTLVSALGGYQSVILSWQNPVDQSLVGVNIYQSQTAGNLGTKVATDGNITPGQSGQYTVTGLTDGTTYYYTLAAAGLTSGSSQIESTYSTQVSAMPQDIAPQNVSASQQSDGSVQITYGLKYSSAVSISYYNPNDGAWHDASSSALSGDVGEGVSGSTSIITHTAYWQAADDFPSQYFASNQNFKIRVNVVADGSSSFSPSGAFLLDTNPPHVNSGESFVVVDATGTSTATVTLTAHEDGSPEQAIQYRLSNSSDMGGATSWTALASAPTVVNNWDLGNNPTVYAQFKDPYDNIANASSSVVATPTNFALKDASSADTSDYRLVAVWQSVTMDNFSKYEIDRSLDGINWSYLDSSTKNAYVDVGLSSSQTYYYRVKTLDTFGDVSRPTEVLSSQPGAAPNITAKPTVTVYDWKQEYGVRAEVTWSTDQNSDSFVVYSDKPLQPGTSTLNTDGTAASVVGQFDNGLSHQVLVQQLNPSTVYYFKTLSQNAIKITGASDVIQLTTPPRIPLIINDLKFTNTTPTSTTVTWQTTKLSTSVINYGPTLNYGSRSTDANYNTDHTIIISSLDPGIDYQVSVVATDSDGNTTQSDNYQVQIPALPQISAVKVSDIQYNSATVTWDTNVNSDSNVQFGSSSSYGSQQGKSDSTTVHSVTVIGLNPATLYHYRVRSSDTYNNVITSSDLTFMTPKDTIPPVISNIANQVTTTGSGSTQKIMAIITWNTDKASTSQVEYGSGISGNYPDKAGDSASFDQSHTVILPSLLPNSSYQYRIISKDAAGNTAIGDPMTVITPPQDKSLIQLVLNSLTETFSWTSKLHSSPIIHGLEFWNK